MDKSQHLLIPAQSSVGGIIFFCDTMFSFSKSSCNGQFIKKSCISNNVYGKYNLVHCVLT